MGISGTNGSGKDTAGKIIADEYGLLFVSVTDLLRDELRKQNLEINRQNMRDLGNKWRREIGPDVLIDKAIEIYEQKASDYKGLVISSLRNPGEAEYIHKLGGTLIWVDADPKIRYERVKKRRRSAEDEKTYEEFLSEEQEEMTSTGDTAALAIGEVKKLCDIFVENNSDNLEALKSDVLVRAETI